MLIFSGCFMSLSMGSEVSLQRGSTSHPPETLIIDKLVWGVHSTLMDTQTVSDLQGSEYRILR